MDCNHHGNLIGAAPAQQLDAGEPGAPWPHYFFPAVATLVCLSNAGAVKEQAPWIHAHAGSATDSAPRDLGTHFPVPSPCSSGTCACKWQQVCALQKGPAGFGCPLPCVFLLQWWHMLMQMAR
eukprot:1137018-Pelagomonas_calceolata.AAC.1